jgi:hypothetical protein
MRGKRNMKKFLIHFMSADMPSVEDDGISDGTNFGIYEKTFDTREEAEKGLEELMLEDKAELEECYGFNDETCDPYVYIEIENGSYDRKQLVVYDKFDARELNVTIYEVVEVEF